MQTPAIFKNDVTLKNHISISFWLFFGEVADHLFQTVSLSPLVTLNLTPLLPKSQLRGRRGEGREGGQWSE